MKNLKVENFGMVDVDRNAQRTQIERIGALMRNGSADRRGAFAAMCELTPIAEGVKFEEVNESDARGLRAIPPNADPARAAFYIHGGGYSSGDTACFRGLISQIAVRIRCVVFAVDYPLAPEARFPAAYNCVRQARDWFADGAYGSYMLIGDSAGGGLALALLADPGSARAPSSVIVMSPWTDLALTGSSFNDAETLDPLFKPEVLAGLAKVYLDGADPKDPRASPLYGVPDSSPPLLIQVGTAELLLDDSKRYAEAAARCGTDVTLQLFEGGHHVFQRDIGTLGIADVALEHVEKFAKAYA